MKKNSKTQEKQKETLSQKPQQSGASSEIEITQKIDELMGQLEDSKKKYLLLLSDFENFKKRVEREKEDLVTGTKVKMLQSILDMDNDLSYATKSSPELEGGVKLIINKLDSFLKSQGIETIQTETYDEDLHEVLSVIKTDTEGIVDVVSKGYTLNGKPFRYPKIILSKNEG